MRVRAKIALWVILGLLVAGCSTVQLVVKDYLEDALTAETTSANEPVVSTDLLVTDTTAPDQTEFTVVPGVSRQFAGGRTLSFVLTTPANITPFTDLGTGQNRKAHVARVTSEADPKVVVDFRVYKLKGISVDGAATSEPRYSPVVAWKPSTSYKVTVTMSSSEARIQIDNMTAEISGNFGPGGYVFTLGNAQAGWPCLNGAVISKVTVE